MTVTCTSPYKYLTPSICMHGLISFSSCHSVSLPSSPPLPPPHTHGLSSIFNTFSQTMTCVHVPATCDCALTHTHTHVYIHSCTHSHTHSPMHTLTHTFTHAHTHTHTHIHPCTHTLIHTFTHAHTHTHIHPCTHSYTHSPMHTHTHIHTFTHAHTHTHIHPCAHTFTHAHTHTHIHPCAHTHTHIHPSRADACGEPRTKYTFLDNTTTMTTGPPPNHTFYMCPICDIECDFWYYQDECMVTWFSLLFDNLGTVIFAAFISIWAVLFMEMWKRRQFVLQHEWDVLGFEAAEVSI